jgi:hypothetical protein
MTVDERVELARQHLKAELVLIDGIDRCVAGHLADRIEVLIEAKIRDHFKVFLYPVDKPS